MSEKQEIRISEVLDLLEQGKNRVQIAEHFRITQREVKALFEHPKLKGKKAKKVIENTFNIVDDTEETSDEFQQEAMHTEEVD